MAKAHVDRRELAELTGYSEAQIARWELGRAPLYPIELIKLCLCVKPEWLLCWARRSADQFPCAACTTSRQMRSAFAMR